MTEMYNSIKTILSLHVIIEIAPQLYIFGLLALFAIVSYKGFYL